MGAGVSGWGQCRRLLPRSCNALNYHLLAARRLGVAAWLSHVTPLAGFARNYAFPPTVELLSAAGPGTALSPLWGSRHVGTRTVQPKTFLQAPRGQVCYLRHDSCFSKPSTLAPACGQLGNRFVPAAAL